MSSSTAIETKVHRQANATTTRKERVMSAILKDNRSLHHMLDALDGCAERIEYECSVSENLATIEFVANTISEYQAEFHLPREAKVLNVIEARVDDPQLLSTVHELRAEQLDLRREIDWVRRAANQALDSETEPADVKAVKSVTSAFVDLATDHIEIQQEAIIPAAEAVLVPADWKSLNEEFVELSADGVGTGAFIPRELAEGVSQAADEVTAKLLLANFLAAHAVAQSTGAALQHAGIVSDLTVRTLRGEAEVVGQFTPAIIEAIRATFDPILHHVQLYRELMTGVDRPIK